MQKIRIISSGSLGLLVDSYLSENHQIIIYVRRQKQQNKRLTYGNNRSSMKQHVQALCYDEIRQENLAITYLKQHDFESVILHIDWSNRDSPIIFLQNGMSHIQLINSMLQSIIVGVVEHGAYRLNDYTVDRTGEIPIKLASFNRSEKVVKNVVEQLHMSDLPILLHDDWGRLTNKYFYELLKHSTYETADILQLNDEYELDRVTNIAHLTNDNHSSMFQNVRVTEQTESGAISGYFYRQPSKKDKPYTSSAYQGVKALEVSEH